MTTSVYPRWRGEHEMLVSVNAANTGLSPLARGTHYAFLRLPGFCRFIPAGAGNTYILKRLLNHKTVYPRWRGEHLKRRASASRLLGLSPLARGTRFCLRYLLLCLRFIPAGAGNTVPSGALAPVASVYPRWRGEHGLRPGSVTGDHGLSPLARGTL